MKILVISMNVGRTAPGIVFERLIYGLSKHHTVDGITQDYDPSIDLSNVRNVITIDRKLQNSKLTKLFLTLATIDPVDVSWANRAADQLKQRTLTDYDLVFSFVSYGHYAALIAGNKIAAALSKRHFVYSVDAIPAPVGWLKDDMFYKGVRKMVTRLFANIDGLFSANKKMLSYQLTKFKPKSNIVTGVIYNPSFGGLQRYHNINNEKNVFLYTGGIYGPRKVDYVLQSFKNILKDYPEAVLEFVGAKLPADSLKIFNEFERKNIIVTPFVKDLTPYYQKAIALLDIDADLPDDIFLSSKITNYININRIIISETGPNSPSREIFKGIPSVLQCDHNVNELTEAMRNAILTKNMIGFEDREQVIGLFKLDNVIDDLNKVISDEN